MDAPHEPISQQSAAQTSSPAIQRTVVVRIDLRWLAALGAGLIALGAFVPWVDASARALLGRTPVAPVIQDWPSLLIGLIALAVLALPQSDSGRWVSLPAAALGLAAAVIAVASALVTAQAVTDLAARLPDLAPFTVTGPGVLLTVAMVLSRLL